MSNSFPTYRGDMEYVCQGCGARFSSDELYYTCPDCKGVFLLKDKRFSSLKNISPSQWRDIFDERLKSKKFCFKGIFLFYELIAPILEEEDIIYLGEGHTPIIEANEDLQRFVGHKFYFKNEGQNPSASFKDRGMACAFSYLKNLIKRKKWSYILTICASTGDTSASAAMYAAYVGGSIKCVVLLPYGRVTPQQLAQPLGSGVKVLEIPGVFDDCMKVVEYLADNYNVALLNSKNSWRILGQESYSFEVAQWFNWDMKGKAVFVPIGNAGNIAAIMSGFIKLYKLGIIDSLPRIFGVQSIHANPIYRYYAQDKESRKYEPVQVSPSVAQAAMIGNPVSFPRVKSLVNEYEILGGKGSFHVVEVKEQEIIEGMLIANRHGHIACTQGGESLAGLVKAKELELIEKDELAVLNSTAHALKFQNFQTMYFEDSFPPEYEITPKKDLVNRPYLILDREERKNLNYPEFIKKVSERIVKELSLTPR